MSILRNRICRKLFVGLLICSAAAIPDAVLAAAGPLQPARVKQAPPAFTPVDIATGEITLTGRSFKPADITTGEISLTGKVFVPADITTGEITLTGKVFAPADITTGEITLTGKQ